MRKNPVILALTAVVALSLTSGVARADDEAARKAEALRHFKAGVAHLEDQDGARYEDAYSEFKRAYDLSRSPKVLGNLGLCAMKLERDGEAIAAYTRYLKEVDDIDPEERVQVARDLEVLTTSVIFVTLRTHPSAATIVDTRLPVRGATITNFYDAEPPATTLKLRLGHHVLTLREDGKDRAQWEFSAVAGERLSHDFLARDEPPPRTAAPSRPPRTAPIVVTGVGAAALLAGGALGLVTLGKLHALESQCPQDSCPGSVFPGNVSSVRPLVRATDYLLLGGGLVAAAGATWWLVTALSGAAPARVGTTAWLDGACASRGCFAGVRGAF